MIHKSAFIILIFGSLFTAACQNTTAPGDLLEEERYVKVFSELVVINQLTDEQLDSVSREQLREQVFEEYDVTSEQFNRSHQYYQQQPEQQTQRIDKVEELLTSERDQFQEKLDEIRKMARDSTALADSLSEASELEDSLALPDSLDTPQNESLD